MNWVERDLFSYSKFNCYWLLFTVMREKERVYNTTQTVGCLIDFGAAFCEFHLSGYWLGWIVCMLCYWYLEEKCASG